jgi:hypothetical protein
MAMKGLESYLQKHGNHFTKELANAVVSSKWDTDTVAKDAQKHVYYNVIGATSGDMCYMTHWLYEHKGWPEAYDKRSSIKMMLWMVGNINVDSPYFFCEWIWDQARAKSDFDFTPYI